MANSSIDENGVRTLLGTLNTNGKTTIKIKVDPTSHSLEVDEGTSGSDNGPTNAPRDENSNPALMAVSSADGVTPVAVYSDSSGNLMITKS